MTMTRNTTKPKPIRKRASSGLQRPWIMMPKHFLRPHGPKHSMGTYICWGGSFTWQNGTLGYLASPILNISPTEIPGSNFFDSDSGSETVYSLSPVPIPVLRLSKSRSRFRFRFRDQTCLELDSDSETDSKSWTGNLGFRVRFRY